MNVIELEKMMKKDVEEVKKNEVHVIHETKICNYIFKIYGTKEEPLFLAQDIAEILDYQRNTDGTPVVRKMLNILDDDEKLMFQIGSSGQIRQMWFVTEDGLYRILMRSDKPNARQFQKQISKILKEIRLTGGYVVEHREEEFIENHYNYLSPELKNAMIKEMQEHIKAQENLIQQQEEKIKLDAPKVESYDQFMNCDGLYTTTNVAKLLDIKRSDLFVWLRENEYVYKQKTVCTVKAENKGYMVMKIVNGYDCMYITPKGLEFIRNNYSINL